jgi:hypothetical protein
MLGGVALEQPKQASCCTPQPASVALSHLMHVVVALSHR